MNEPRGASAKVVFTCPTFPSLFSFGRVVSKWLTHHVREDALSDASADTLADASGETG